MIVKRIALFLLFAGCVTRDNPPKDLLEYLIWKENHPSVGHYMHGLPPYVQYATWRYERDGTGTVFFVIEPNQETLRRPQYLFRYRRMFLKDIQSTYIIKTLTFVFRDTVESRFGDAMEFPSFDFLWLSVKDDEGIAINKLSNGSTYRIVVPTIWELGSYESPL